MKIEFDSQISAWTINNLKWIKYPSISKANGNPLDKNTRRYSGHY